MNTLKGKILLINRMRGFGFLECPKINRTLFFWKGNVAEWEDLDIYDTVRFQIERTTKGKHKGKEQAVNLTKVPIEEEDAIEIKFGASERWVGTLIQWDGEKGYFEVEHLSKQIFIKHTTLACVDIKKVKEGEVFIIHPVASNNPKSHYYTRFAYPLEKETNVDFLSAQYQKLSKEVEKSKVETILNGLKEYVVLWKAKCDTAARTEDGKISIQALTKIKIHFETKGYEPTREDWIYAASGDETYYTALWLQELHEFYSIDEIKDYFIVNSDEFRLMILTRLKANPDHQLRIIEHYLNSLETSGEIQKSKTRLRHLLVLVQKAERQVKDALYDDLKGIFNTLSTHAKIALWAEGFTEYIDIDNLLGDIDFKNTHLVIELLKRRSDSKEKIAKIITDHFFNIITPETFEEWYPFLIPVLKYLQKNTGDYRFRNRLESVLTPTQWFKIGILGFTNWLSINPETEIPKVKDWPLYARIRCYLICNQKEKDEPVDLSALKSRIIHDLHGTDAELLLEASQMQWNQVLTPCKATPIVDFEIGYMEDLIEFQSLTGLFSIALTGPDSIAAHIFNSIKPFEPFHARLWLHRHVPREFYDYVGFRNPFKKLSKIEKGLFKSPSDKLMSDAIIQIVIHEIPACQSYEDRNDYRVYFAKMLNIHFENGSYRLKTPQGFTEFIENHQVVSSYNYISRIKEVRNLTIELHVKGNRILFENGLEEVHNLIINEKLKRGIKSTSKQSSNEQVEISYTDDLILQERILTYLRNLQSAKYSIVLVSPHVFEFDFNEIDEYSKPDKIVSALFSIEHNNDIVVVWEFYTLEEGNATYVFKTSPSLYEIMIERLIDLVSTTSGVRRMLNSKEKSLAGNNLVIAQKLRTGVGYVTNFKIKRGDLLAFEGWEIKLKKALGTSIPEWLDDTSWTEAFETGITGKSVDLPFTGPPQKPHKEDGKVELMSGEEQVLNDDGSDEETASTEDLLVNELKSLNDDLKGLISKLKL